MTVIKIPSQASDLNFDGERFVPCDDVSDELAMEHLHRYAAATGFVSGKKVLDIASGEGYGSYLLSQVAESVVGVDVDPKAVMHAQARYQNKNLSYMNGSCESIPCPDASVDVVVSFETLEHISEHENFMAEIKRVLSDDGVLLLSTPNIAQYNALREETNPFHLKELNRAEFETLLGKYFKTCHIGGQAGFFCSSLVFAGSDGGGDTNKTNFSVFSQNDIGEITILAQPKEPAYLLAVASDAEIDIPVSSFYEGNVKRNIISALEGGIVERDGWCLDKDNHIQSLNNSINTLQESEQQFQKQVKDLDAQLAEYQQKPRCLCAKLKEKFFGNK